MHKLNFYFQPQDDLTGYNYEVPENPLTISRPEEPIEAASDLAADSQQPHDEGSHGGGHGHHGGSGDPLDWLRESIPGIRFPKNSFGRSKFNILFFRGTRNRLPYSRRGTRDQF